jgi:hypothetical protein
MGNITDEFLDKLKELAQEYGWEGDFSEVVNFIEWCHDKAGKDFNSKNFQPFE